MHLLHAKKMRRRKGNSWSRQGATRRLAVSDFWDMHLNSDAPRHAICVLQKLATTLCCAAQQKSPSNFTKYCACQAKWMSSMICVTYESSFPMRGASKVSFQPHQILRLPRKMNVIDDLRHIWKLISNAWSKSRHPPTSPNTAPATQNECQEWFASHMKPHFQCVKPVKSPPNLAKYCAWHEILKVKICAENPWSASANRKTIRP